LVTRVQTCALPICIRAPTRPGASGGDDRSVFAHWPRYRDRLRPDLVRGLGVGGRGARVSTEGEVVTMYQRQTSRDRRSLLVAVLLAIGIAGYFGFRSAPEPPTRGACVTLN